MKHEFSLQDNLYKVVPIYRRDDIRLSINDRIFDVKLKKIDNFEYQLTLNGKTYSAVVAQNDNDIYVHIGGQTLSLAMVDSAAEAMADNLAEGSLVEAPMPGVVIDSLVEVGDSVEEGQTLLLIESMKLQIELKANASGVIEQVPFSSGESFNKGEILMTLAVEGEAS